MYKLIEEVVLRPKKSSLLSGNRPGEKLLTRPHSQIWIRIYVFNFKKQAKKERKNKNTKKEKENISGKSIEKICGRPGEDFPRHPHFREQENLGFFWPDNF